MPGMYLPPLIASTIIYHSFLFACFAVLRTLICSLILFSVVQINWYQLREDDVNNGMSSLFHKYP